MNRLATILATLVTAAAIVINLAGPANAHHAGYYVLNSDNVAHNALIRDHDWGTRSWQFLYPNTYSKRGAEGIMVRPGTRILFKSIQTGQIYWTACGEDYGAAGYWWAGYPYYPLPANRSIQLLDKATYPNGAASSCNG